MLSQEAGKLLSGMMIKHSKNTSQGYRVLGKGKMKVDGIWIDSVTYQATTGMGLIFTRSIWNMYNFVKV